MAVTAIVHIGHNARTTSLQEFEKLGLDLVAIMPGSRGDAMTRIDPAVAQALPSQFIGLEEAAPYIQGGGSLRVGQFSSYAEWIAVSDSFYGLIKAQIERGRLTSFMDGYGLVAVLGHDVAAQIQNQTGEQISIGDTITLDTNILTIVGILHKADSSLILGVDLNKNIVVPFPAASRFQAGRLCSVAARLSPGWDDREVEQRIKDYFSRLPQGGGEVRVQTAHEMLRGVDRQMQIYTLLLVGIGAISLVVGGVGVMNVMLMNILQRSREIGLRMALGARRKDIRALFLVEAVFLSLMGTGAGVAVGTLAAWIFAVSSGWDFVMSPDALPLGIGMAMAVGLFFGAYPAIRASRLEPIATLRSD